MKKLYRILYDKLDRRLDHLEINQGLKWYEREKPRPTVEKDPGRWPLFT